MINHEAAAISRWEKANPDPEPGTRLQVVDTRKEKKPDES